MASTVVWKRWPLSLGSVYNWQIDQVQQDTLLFKLACILVLCTEMRELVLLELHEIALSEGGRRGWYKQSWPDVSTPCYLPIYILPHFPNPSLDNRKVDESGWKYPQCYMHLWLTNRVPRVNQRLCRCLLTFQRKNCDHSEMWEGVFGLESDTVWKVSAALRVNSSDRCPVSLWKG